MGEISKHYEPSRLLFFFEELCKIPRGSFNESGVADYLCAFAAERGLDCYRDGEDNVLIRKGACGGHPDPRPILLQGHTDMVCEKKAEVEHDFLRDPIDIYVEDGWLRAKGTTLGADNGTAVAAMLAVLDDDSLCHPPLECLFTSKEEVGLLGATAFDYSHIHARRMINLDSEAETALVAGCAGGLRSDIKIPVRREPLDGTCCEIFVGGLMGGHSGADIHCGRANANKVLAGILLAVMGRERVNLVKLWGGMADNAITREAGAVIAVSDMETVQAIVREQEVAIAKTLSAEDSGFFVRVSPVEETADMVGLEDSRKVISAMAIVANGVLKMSHSIADHVEFSRNLGIVELSESEALISFSTRSAIESQLDASVSELDALAVLCGGETVHYGRYPGWEYVPVSELRERCLAAVKELYGRELRVYALHAGLECGIIKSHVPDMDILSIGPSVKDFHSPDEALDLASCERCWKLILKLLAE